jgi:hypothetical protein
LPAAGRKAAANGVGLRHVPLTALPVIYTTLP